MYNYYCEQKKKHLEEEKEKIERREKHYKEKRKKMVSNLYEKYENRVKEFIMDMVASPIQVKDYLNPIENTRKEFLQEEDQKIQGRRGIVLKGFKTEKERIKDHLRNVHQLYLDTTQNKTKDNILLNENISRLETNNNLSLNKSKDHDRNKVHFISSYDGVKILQPEMRYKPRTDLERIYDEISKNSVGRINRHVIDKQLKELDLIVTKKTKDENEEEHLEYKPEYMLMTKISKVDPTRDFSIDERDQSAKKDKKVEDKRKKMNVEAKNIMSELHNKTHFKGATEIANRTSNNRIIKHVNSSSTAFDEDKIFKVTEENFLSEPALPREEFKKNFNPYGHIGEEKFRNTSLELIHKIAFSTEDKNGEAENKNKKARFFKNLTKHRNTGLSMMKNHPMHFFKNIVLENPLDDPMKKGEDEKIVVDDQMILRSRVDLIASKVLTKCNVKHKKNKNNNKILKNGEGKLMMTNGMTINEFEHKYNLKCH